MASLVRVELAYGYLLHRRPYRETSVLADIFTADHGRVGIVAKGARRARSPLRQSLQAFRPMLFSWQGRGELMNLTAAETRGHVIALDGPALASGFYANEVLLRLLPRNDPNETLFDAYERLLAMLRGGHPVEPVLREFEKELLNALGYGLELQRDTQDRPIDAQRRYLYVPETGPVALEESARATDTTVSGATLIGLANGDLGDSELIEAKRLMRHLLSQYLGDKPLMSRELFRRSRPK
ncbi:MAG: DNA repair protein RecO [Gammaproteobacteria bacterium]|nr:DNA repair protein RecO [Gammaproteobacteria bacterium]